MTESTQNKSSFFQHLHAFRGFAIICIVLGHCLAGAAFFSGGKEVNSTAFWFNSIAETLGRGGTIYFALISGLLFSLVLSNKSWSHFFKGKVLNVLLPFLFMTIFYTLFKWYNGWLAGDGLSLEQGITPDLLLVMLKNAFTGGALFHMWYIPVLMVLFIMTPLVHKLVAEPKLRWLVFALIIVPLVSTRVWPDFSFKTVFYFLGSYTAGIYIGVNYQAKLETISRFKNVLMILFTTTFIATLTCYQLELEKFHFIAYRESLVYIQKMSLALLVLLWFKHYEEKLPTWLDTFANYAFPIYFIHAFFEIVIFREILSAESGPYSLISLFAYGTLGGIVVLLISLLTSILIKKGLKKYSRFFIGA